MWTSGPTGRLDRLVGGGGGPVEGLLGGATGVPWPEPGPEAPGVPEEDPGVPEEDPGTPAAPEVPEVPDLGVAGIAGVLTSVKLD